MDSKYRELYAYIYDHASARSCQNTLTALSALERVMSGEGDPAEVRDDIPAAPAAYWLHSLSVCRMLLDLPLALSDRDEDILLASALCHVLPEIYCVPDLKALVTGTMGLDEAIYETVMVLFRNDPLSDIQQRRYFERLREVPLALLIKLTDRGNLVEQLYGISGWSAREYLHETKVYFLPLCVYAKEHYPHLLAPVSVLMEKMRNLSEVSEILLSRYELRENALTQEIFLLEEDNATLRRMIQELRRENAEASE